MIILIKINYKIKIYSLDDDENKLENRSSMMMMMKIN